MKFDPARAERLNDPERLEDLRPDAMWAALGKPEPSTIVDVGAGTGLLAVEFARRAPAANVYAADVSPEMLEWMTAHLPADVAPRITPVLSAETSVPLEDGIADLVTMIALYHELDDPPASLAEAARLLAPGGSLLIVDWKKQPTPHGPDMAMRVSTERIAEQVREAGYADVTVHDVLPDFSVVTARRRPPCCQRL